MRVSPRAAVLAGLTSLIAPVAYLAPLGLAPLTALAAVLVIGPWWIAAPWFPVIAAIAAFSLWAAVAMIWSPIRPWAEASSASSALQHMSAIQFALLMLCALFLMNAAEGLTRRHARMAARCLAFAIVALGAILVCDGLAGAGIYSWLAVRFQPQITPDLALIYAARGGYVLAPLLWPAGLILWLRGHRRLALIGPCGAVATAFLLHQDAPLAALTAGVAAFGLVWADGVVGLSVVGGLSALYWLAAPWIINGADAVIDLYALADRLPPSWRERVDIWIFAAHRVATHPWLGWGMDSSRAFVPDIPLHPHNAALQVWLELGLPGAVLAALVIAAIFRRLAGLVERDRMLVAAAAASAAAYQTIGAFSFGLWQQWWLAVGVLTALAIVLAARHASWPETQKLRTSARTSMVSNRVRRPHR